jgi:hypothetical protein
MLHLENVLIVLEVIMPDLIVVLEEHFKLVLEFLILTFELLIGLDEHLVLVGKFGVNEFHLGNLIMKVLA